MPKCILAEQGGKGGGGSSIVLTKIEVTTPPTKTSYLAGDSFQTAGMVVTASYGMEGSAAVIATAEVSGYSISPSVLTDGTTRVTISYSEQGNTCTTTQAVSVTHKLTKIAVTTNPTTTSYEYGATLSTTGMVVTATYSDGKTTTVTGSCSPTALNTVTNSQAITVSYTENGVTCTTTFNVVVNRKSVSKPTWKNSNPTYTGSSINVGSSTYWNNYNTTYFSASGVSGTNAGSYTATFTLKNNYRWNDGTTAAITVSWTIAQADNTVTVNPASVSINGNNYSAGVTVTVNRKGTGTVSVTNVPSGITATVNSPNNADSCTITVKGNGTTAVAATNITVNVAAVSTSYKSCSTILSVSATYWSFGDDGTTVDAAWFAGLKNYVTSNSASIVASTASSEGWVGKTKSVTLTSSVLGTTTHLIRCIGVNQDGDNTVTFQTKNCLPTTTVFSNSNQHWIGSTARTQCQNYYNAFPGKASIKTVSKYTNNGSLTANDETVFLPSHREVGFAESWAPTGEFCVGESEAYSYYTSASSRIKNQSDSSSSAAAWWLRSRYTNDSDSVCFVYGNGYAYSNTYYGSSRLAPAFVIG